MDARWLTVGVGAFVLATAACRPNDVCAEPDDAPCGGNLLGEWNMIDSCQDPVSSADLAAIAKRNYRGQPSVPAGVAPPELTSTDWCADLKYASDGIEFLNLPRNPPKLQGAFLVYQGDRLGAQNDGSSGAQDASSGSQDSADASSAPSNAPTSMVHGAYSALVTTNDTTTFDFSNECIGRFGYTPASCHDFATAFAVYAAPLGGLHNTSCVDDGAGGCTCTYTIESDAAGTKLTGLWSVDGNVITHYREDMALPSQADFCVRGDIMTLWGHDRTSLLDVGGVRTMTLRRSVCGNGFVERGEDCDPPDGVTCSANCLKLATP